MSKQEYVRCIEKALVGKVSAQELRDTVEYYRDYIDMEIRKGKSEQEVLEALGDPRLLAKTIAMTSGYGNHGSGMDTAACEEKKEKTTGGKTKSWHIPLLAMAGILILVLVLVASVALSVLRILLPFVLPVMMLLWIVRLLRKR